MFFIKSLHLYGIHLTRFTRLWYVYVYRMCTYYIIRRDTCCRRRRRRRTYNIIYFLPSTFVKFDIVVSRATYFFIFFSFFYFSFSAVVRVRYRYTYCAENRVVVYDRLLIIIFTFFPFHFCRTECECLAKFTFSCISSTLLLCSRALARIPSWC